MSSFCDILRYHTQKGVGKGPRNYLGSNMCVAFRPGCYKQYRNPKREHLISQPNCKVAGAFDMSRILTSVFVNSGRIIRYPQVKLYDRGEYPALLIPTGLKLNPDLQC